MILPIDPTATSVYYHESDLNEHGDPKPNASEFHVRCPTLRHRLRIADRAARVRTDDLDDERALEIRSGAVRLYRIKAGLSRVVNFPGWKTEVDDVDPEGPEVPTDDFIASIPDEVADGLAERISSMSELTEEAVGKSGPQSGQPTKKTSETPAAPATS